MLLRPCLYVFVRMCCTCFAFSLQLFLFHLMSQIWHGESGGSSRELIRGFPCQNLTSKTWSLILNLGWDLYHGTCWSLWLETIGRVQVAALTFPLQNSIWASVCYLFLEHDPNPVLRLKLTLWDTPILQCKGYTGDNSSSSPSFTLAFWSPVLPYFLTVSLWIPNPVTAPVVLPGGGLPTQPLSPSASSTGQGKTIRENQTSRWFNFCHRRNWLDLERLNLLPIEIGLNIEKQRQIKTTPSCPCLFPRLSSFIPDSSTSPPTAQGDGEWRAVASP